MVRFLLLWGERDVFQVSVTRVPKVVIQGWAVVCFV